MTHLPTDFLENIRSQLGNEYGAFLKSFEAPMPVSVRLNPKKRIGVFDAYERVPWASDAYYLPERIPFTLDPLFHAGCYYVQEASSMFLENALRQIILPGKPVKVLDLCAAPGGKSTHILSTLPEGSLLVSNEVIPSRNKILQQNITKWGFDNVVVTQNEAVDFLRLPGYFDIIVVDAPCSGEGLFRKQPDAVEEWNMANVNHCAIRQSAILDEVYDALNENGYLIYCTCTFETSENEQQVDRMINKYNMKLVQLKSNFEGIETTSSGLRFYPHRIKGEGFFISVMQKREQSPIFVSNRKKPAAKNNAPFFPAYLQQPGQYSPFTKNNELYAFANSHFSDIMLIMENLFTRMAGIHIGTIKGKDLVPSHDLALSNERSREIIAYEMNEADALNFLRCGNPSVTGLARGFYLATYKGHALGWFKEVGGRINNYLPRDYRILKS